MRSRDSEAPHPLHIRNPDNYTQDGLLKMHIGLRVLAPEECTEEMAALHDYFAQVRQQRQLEAPASAAARSRLTIYAVCHPIY